MPTPTVLFRADASETIGAGHLMRCLALAEGFKEHGTEPVFVSRTRHPAYVRALQQRGFAWTAIEEELPFEEEPATIARLRPPGTVAGVVVDGYWLPQDYFVRIRALEPAWTLAYIDDLGQLSDGIDLLINQNLSADERSYPGADEKGVRILAGPRYALLRSEFRKRPHNGSTRRAGVSRILLTLGGGDTANHTLRILRALDSLDPRIELHVVQGPGFRHRADVDAYASARPRVRLWSDVPDMCQLMLGMDLSINGSGSTLWELYYLGLPNILYVLADNQAPVAERAHALGCSLSLGSIARFDPRALLEAVQRLVDSPEERGRMSERARDVVDGSGVDRVSTVFLSLCARRIAA